ncbi:Tn3 family transposase [Chryseobacterium potabilaquae]|nr:Tn3 family transposase [Chryseobacterium potabilaquae]
MRSILFKRLSSYSRQNPVYLALRDFGRLVRTKFLLDYMYDHNLRKMVLQQLNKGESANKLAKRIFYGNNGEIKYVSKQEHLQATICKTLIHNLIVCWNYMYLSKKLVQITPENRKEFFEHIKNTSPVRWEHFNFYGIFDFSPEALKDALEFNTEDLFDFEME